MRVRCPPPVLTAVLTLSTKIKHPQSALLSNHEVLLHLQAEQAEHYGPDQHGRKRTMPKGLEEVLSDVRLPLEFTSLHYSDTR
jgi:hypothetical protein